MYAVLDHFGAVVLLTDKVDETFTSEDFHCIEVISLSDLREKMNKRAEEGNRDFKSWFEKLLSS